MQIDLFMLFKLEADRLNWIRKQVERIQWIRPCRSGDFHGYGPYTVQASSDGWFYGVENMAQACFWPKLWGNLDIVFMIARIQRNKKIMRAMQRGCL